MSSGVKCTPVLLDIVSSLMDDGDVPDIGVMIDRVKDAQGIDRDADLATQFGVSRQVVSGWRHEKSRPSPSNLKTLHDLYRAAQREINYKRADTEDLRRRAHAALDTLSDTRIRDLAEVLESYALDQLKANLGVTEPSEEPPTHQTAGSALVQRAADGATRAKSGESKQNRTG